MSVLQCYCFVNLLFSLRFVDIIFMYRCHSKLIRLLLFIYFLLFLYKSTSSFSICFVSTTNSPRVSFIIFLLFPFPVSLFYLYVLSHVTLSSPPSTVAVTQHRGHQARREDFTASLGKSPRLSHNIPFPPSLPASLVFS